LEDSSWGEPFLGAEILVATGKRQVGGAGLPAYLKHFKKPKGKLKIAWMGLH
jgi:hypothetical protein